MSDEGDAGARVIPSRARRVTLFEDRAEVTRGAEVDLPSGTTWVRLSGVSPFVDDRSVQARVVDGEKARVHSARVRWRAHLEKELGREAIEALEAELRAARARAREAEDALERATAAGARAEGLRARWIEGAGAVPRGVRKEEVAAAWRASLAEIERALTEALSAAASAREAQRRAADDLARAQVRLSLGTVETPRYEAHVEVELAAAGAGVASAAIEVTYRVPCALWRPEHLIRLPGPAPAQGAEAKIEVVTLATAWQRTGETWDDVEVRFSTARPARDASPPALADDVLASRRKTDWERSRVEVSLREQAVMVAGLDRGTRAVDEMPGVDDGGEPLLFSPRERVSIAWDGRPFRIEVARAPPSTPRSSASSSPRWPAWRTSGPPPPWRRLARSSPARRASPAARAWWASPSSPSSAAASPSRSASAPTTACASGGPGPRSARPRRCWARRRSSAR